MPQRNNPNDDDLDPNDEEVNPHSDESDLNHTPPPEPPDSPDDHVERPPRAFLRIDPDELLATICAWCRPHDKSAAMLWVLNYLGPGYKISHGMCPLCKLRVYRDELPPDKPSRS